MHSVFTWVFFFQIHSFLLTIFVLYLCRTICCSLFRYFFKSFVDFHFYGFIFVFMDKFGVCMCGVNEEEEKWIYLCMSSERCRTDILETVCFWLNKCTVNRAWWISCLLIDRTLIPIDQQLIKLILHRTRWKPIQTYTCHSEWKLVCFLFFFSSLLR